MQSAKTGTTRDYGRFLGSAVFDKMKKFNKKKFG
jgi:hypothetical protein